MTATTMNEFKVKGFARNAEEGLEIIKKVMKDCENQVLSIETSSLKDGRFKVTATINLRPRSI